ncbi:MAG: lysozyme [Pseudomonadota bacterium]
MRTSRAGIDLIKSFEGFHRRAVPLGDGRWTVGYGHIKGARAGVGIVKEDAEAILREYDLPPVERQICDAVYAPLNQNQFDALVSFVFNIGNEAFLGSSVLEHLNSGEHLQAADGMGAWRVAEVNGRTILIDALVRRRAAETALFLTPSGPRVTAPTAKITPKFDESKLPLGQLRAALEPVSEQKPASAPLVLNQPHAQLSSDTLSASKNNTEGGDELPLSSALLPTETDDAASDMKERLVRILGSSTAGAEASATEKKPAQALSVPSPAEITEAISALADPDPVGNPSDDGDSEGPSRSTTRIVIDDLETVDIDPRLVATATAREATLSEMGDVGVASYSLYAGLGLIGLFIAVFGFTDLFAAMTPGANVPAGEQYSGFGLSLLGAFLVLVAVYFIAKSWIIDRS